MSDYDNLPREAVSEQPIRGSWTDPKFWDPTNTESVWAQTLGTPGTKTDAFIRNAANSASLGTARLASNAVNGSGTWEKDTAAASKANPGSALAGSIAGAVPSALVIGSGAPGIAAGIEGAGARGALVGGVEGATAPADTLSERAANAVKGAGIGTVLSTIPAAAADAVSGQFQKIFLKSGEDALSKVKVPPEGTSWTSPAWNDLDAVSMAQTGAGMAKGLWDKSKELLVSSLAPAAGGAVVGAATAPFTGNSVSNSALAGAGAAVALTKAKIAGEMGDTATNFVGRQLLKNPDLATTPVNTVAGAATTLGTPGMVQSTTPSNAYSNLPREDNRPPLRKPICRSLG